MDGCVLHAFLLKLPIGFDGTSSVYVRYFLQLISRPAKPEEYVSDLLMEVAGEIFFNNFSE
ncbi:MAG: hypothetical protein M3015_08660 [Bacteroidota bacterium]|nr:hypothetical protein [Bacteroidota bacterium]